MPVEPTAAGMHRITGMMPGTPPFLPHSMRCAAIFQNRFSAAIESTASRAGSSQYRTRHLLDRLVNRFFVNIGVF